MIRFPPPLGTIQYLLLLEAFKQVKYRSYLKLNADKVSNKRIIMALNEMATIVCNNLLITL